MEWTNRDEKVLAEILAWEQQYFNYEPSDFGVAYESWLEAGVATLNPKVREKALQTVDSVLFHLHALIQNSQFQIEGKQRLLNEARLFNEDIEGITDLKTLKIDQLRYIATQHIARQRLLSFAQGGLTGTGGFLLLGLDFPAVIAMNLRSVQLVAMTYGYEVSLPSEMVSALKVFHTAALPKRLRHGAWQELEDEVFNKEYDPFFYEGHDDFADGSWFEHGLKQIAKAVVISMLRKKLVQGVPFIGIAFGAGTNYQFSRRVTDLAHRFYQKRYLVDKKTMPGE